ncbi:phospholipase D family protein, partial [Vibrio makurazakiensis]|uniref:phospholipase D family protein n=1 Tax=Vibrio makurazakiensis TaxID=2910250 RepID=UPI003D0AE093
PVIKRISITLLIGIILGGCGTLPNEVKHSPEKSTPHSSSSLSELRDVYSTEQSVADTSGVLFQNTGWEALAQRLALVESAEHSIDIQYYIWNSDISGQYLASRLISAADRGVEVRVMLDDINLNEREDLLVYLDSHPKIDIRVFNPTPNRSGVAKWLSVLGDFSRLNRRMHNKSFTVDGAWSVVGGRNIGDEYFDLSDEINFRDRDVLVTGPVVNDIQASFVDYWDSQWSYPVELLGGDAALGVPEANSIMIPSYRNYPDLPQSKPEANRYMHELAKNMKWVKASFTYDSPVPLDETNTSEPKETAQLLSKLAQQSEHEVLLESAYLIFDDPQLEEWDELASRDVDIKALTNSMASNDLTTNHSGYAGRRKDMLENGIQLFELKPETSLCEESTRDESKCAPTLAYGLHAKSAVFDRKIASVGSFNFNLRSTYLNTESILVIEDESVAQSLALDIENAMNEDNSWYLDLKEGDVYWHSEGKSWDSEPETGNWERFQSRFLQLIPIEKYL